MQFFIFSNTPADYDLESTIDLYTFDTIVHHEEIID